MGFFAKLFSSKKEKEPEATLLGAAPLPSGALRAEQPGVNEYVRLGLDRPMTQEEKDLVSVIASVIVAEDRPSSHFHIKSITAVDEDKVVAVLAVSGLLAGDTGASDSGFVLRSIVEI